jgi:hypothetical protein
MAIEKEEQPIRTWLLVNTEEPITDETWPHIKEVFKKNILDIYPGVIRADWVEGTYDLVIPVVAENDQELDRIIDQIESLTFSPNKANVKDTTKVKGHNPEPPAEDPLRDNEWG